jgi:hypothetical protein
MTSPTKRAAGRPKTAPKDPNAPKETKADKFRRLATARVPSAIKRINAVAKLSGSGYEYTPEQASKIVTALVQAVNALRQRFEGGSVQAEEFDI